MKGLMVWLGVMCLVAFAGNGVAADKVLNMSTTTSTEASGLLEVLLPEFLKDTGIKVKVVAKGTGAALRDGEDGNVDVIFVHAKAREEEFIAKGFGTKRYAVMHNDFIIIGPESDPAGIKGLTEAVPAMQKIAAVKAPFISRGDDSGTHTMEQSLWKATGLPLAEQTQKVVSEGKEKEIKYTMPADSSAWYMSIGQGMGKVITFAEEKQAYTLTDRGTFIKMKWGKTPGVALEILCEGGDSLANFYGVIPVNPAKHPHVSHDLAVQFAEWLVSPRGQGVIAGYTLEGKQLFFPDAIKK